MNLDILSGDGDCLCTTTEQAIINHVNYCSVLQS